MFGCASKEKSMSKLKTRNKSKKRGGRSQVECGRWRPETVLIVCATLLMGIPVLAVVALALTARDTTVLTGLLSEMFVPTTLILGGFLMNMSRKP